MNQPDFAYRVCEKLAYSFIGKQIATIIRNRYYPNARVHWVQQGMAEWNMSRVGGK